MFIKFLKKKKLEANSFLRLTQLQIDNNKLSIDDISNMIGKSEIWFWNDIQASVYRSVQLLNHV